MKRTLVALGILGLAWAVALPARGAETVLFKTDFTETDLSKIFKDVGGFYMQGVDDAVRNGTVPVVNGVPQVFFVENGVLRSTHQGSGADILNPDDTGGTDGTSTQGADPASVRPLLLFGLDTWPADQTITSHILDTQGQNIGAVGLVLRAAKKTKATDPDSWYEFRYTTGNSASPQDEEDAGIADPTPSPDLRIMKVVSGKWSILAESTDDDAANLPAINAAGADNATGAIFRFTAAGDTLTGFISMDKGATFKQWLQVKDSDLKTGLAGITAFDYGALFDDLEVDTP